MVSVVRPEFVPDPSLDREAMEDLQRRLAAEALFEDDGSVDVAAVGAGGLARFGAGAPTGAAADGPADESVAGASDAPADGAAESDEAASDESPPGAPIVAGVDQAFRDPRGDDPVAVSGVVAMVDGEVVERAHAERPVEIPYVPGLLSFREGGAILAALADLSVEPDVLLVDGSGRIHYRQAGLATHVGVTCGVPAVGVAKSLLCGTPEASTEGLAVGDVVPIRADEQVTAPDGTALGDVVIGAAVQTRQFDAPGRHVNPLYVSPGHRVGWETAADLVLATTAGYKLPEPVREADRWVGELTAGE